MPVNLTPTRRVSFWPETAQARNLVAVTALMARDRGAPPLCGQLMIVPVTDYPKPGYPSFVENGQGYGLTAAG